MTNLLTKRELQELNNRMLGKGAPVVIDGTGYNKVDFGRMEYLGYKSELSDKDAQVIATTLVRYTKTQLTAYADKIVATAKYFSDAAKLVKVVDSDNESVKLMWSFNKNVSEALKYTLDKSYFRWMKTESGEWMLNIQWSYVDELIKVMNAEGFDTSMIVKTQAEPKVVAPVVKQPVEFHVERLEGSIDTLTFTTPYNKKVVDAFHAVPYTFFNKGKNTWECYIEHSARLYDELVKAGLDSSDLAELEPWRALVAGWEKSYQLIDISKKNLKFTPYDFQPVDSQRLLDLKVGLNGNEVGCGKTFEQVIIGESLPMKKLVICPPTLRINWVKEIQIVNPEANVHIIYSADEFKVVDGWNIIGYNSLDKFMAELEAEMFQVIMIDEAHYIQAVSNAGTPESKRAFAVLRLAATANYVYPITGTPKTNRNKNLFNILRVIRHPLTRGKWAFMNYGKEYCDGERGAWGWDFSGNSNDEALNSELTPHMVRHLKKDVLPNLTKQRVSLPVEVDLREYKRQIAEYLQNRGNKASEDLARLTKAKQVVAIQKAKESIEFAKNFIDEGKKVVIVTCFTEVVNQVEKAFKQNCVKVVGGMSDKAKNQAVEQFQTGAPQVMVINIIAGGTGITLTAASTMIINDIDWVPGNVEQAEGRIWRGGQTETAMIYYPVAVGCEMDELLVDVITSKSATINAAIDGGSADEIDLRKLVEEKIGK